MDQFSQNDGVELSEFGSDHSSKINLMERIERSINDHASKRDDTSDDFIKLRKAELNRAMTANYNTGRNNSYFKDALNQNQVIAYAIGHLANDLIINVWNTYSTWYMN